MFFRFIWAIILLSSFSFLIYNVVKEITFYYSYPTRTSVSVEFMKRMQFPAVTLCDIGWRNKSKLDNSSQAYTYYGSLSPYRDMLPNVDWNDKYYKDNGYFEDGKLAAYVKTAKDFSMFAIFDKDEVMWKDRTKHVVTPLGVCSTFNAKGKLTTGFSGSPYNLHLFIDLNLWLNTWTGDLGDGLQVKLWDKKEEDWLSAMTKAPTSIEKPRKLRDNTLTPSKTSITQRLRTDLGRSVRVIIASQLVWLNRFKGSQPSH